jgi:predicted GIY-YIG superfamily endonuclease
MTPKTYIVYLLHFEQTGKAKHYIGICLKERLTKRLWEHATQRGARLTSRVVAAGHTLYLTKTWEACDPQLEKRIKQAGHFERRCPMCATPPWDDYKPLLTIRPQPRKQQCSSTPEPFQLAHKF